MLNLSLVLLPLLVGDWYGFATSLSLVSLVIARCWTLRASRQSLATNLKRAVQSTKSKPVKLFVTLPNDNVVTIRTLTGIVQDCLLTETRPLSKEAHSLARALCWLFFGLYAVSLGMASLTLHFVIVLLMISFSVAVAQDWFGNNGQETSTRIGDYLLVQRHVQAALRIDRKRTCC
jgi:hypothetical protein